MPDSGNELALPWIERILRVLDHIQSHLDEELAPEELAKLAAFSTHHFHRVFRGMTGESVMGLVRRLRLERAAQRLRYGQEPVTQVALSTGYESHEAFTRAFRRRFGTSPKDFREQERSALAERVTFEIRTQPRRVVVAYRYVGDYDQAGHAWIELQKRVPAASATASFGLVYDDPEITETAQLRYDACLELPAALRRNPLPEGCQLRTIPGGRYAVAVHHGPYETSLSTYITLLGRWLPQRGVELADEPVVENYIHGPENVAPEDYVTEICVRIE